MTESNIGRAEKPAGDHMLYTVMTPSQAIMLTTQRKQTALEEADRLRDQYGKTYVVQELRLYSTDPPRIIHRAEPKEA